MSGEYCSSNAARRWALSISVALASACAQAPEADEPRSPSGPPARANAIEAAPPPASDVPSSPAPTTVSPPTPSAEQTAQRHANAFKLTHANNKVVASDGEISVALPTPARATSLERVDYGADGRTVKLAYKDDFACPALGDVYELTLDASFIEARVLNARGLRAHHAGRYERAAGDFARATQLDPSFVAARTNLACARARSAQPREAIAALAPLVRDNPVLVYSKVMTDADLASLRSEPEFTMLRAKTPGAVAALSPAALGPAPLVGLQGNWLILFVWVGTGAAPQCLVQSPGLLDFLVPAFHRAPEAVDHFPAVSRLLAARRLGLFGATGTRRKL